MTTVHVPFPPQLEEALALLRHEGVAAWLVGGYVRDALLNRPSRDADIVVQAEGMHWARRLADALEGAFVPLDEENDIGRVVFRTPDGVFIIDVSGMRGGSIEADLVARDFTINALALAAEDGRLVDVTGGYADLNRRVVRMVSPRTFEDDPLRLMRGVRMVATLGFVLEAATMQTMQAHAHRLPAVAAERVRDEFLKIMAVPRAAMHVALLERVGLIDHLLPELAACRDVQQGPPHTLDVYGHTLAVLDALERLWPWTARRDVWQRPWGQYRRPLNDYLHHFIAHEQPVWLLLKITALLHDIGKPVTRTVGDDGRVHYYEHEHVGSELAQERLKALRFPQKSVAWVSTVIRQHLRPLFLTRHPRVSRRALYRLFRDAGETTPAVALHSVADQLGKGGATITPELRRVVAAIWRAAFTPDEAIVNPRPPLTGHDLMALGIPAGPVLGRIIERLKEGVATGRIRTREDAERRALQLWKSWGSSPEASADAPR
nr:HD domain-containing protein [Ardenticatena sp.]